MTVVEWEERCQCRQLSVDLPGPSLSVVACHCSDCQRRTGSPFGVLAYYSDDCVKIAGEATRYKRPTATGGRFELFFCQPVVLPSMPEPGSLSSRELLAAVLSKSMNNANAV